MVSAKYIDPQRVVDAYRKTGLKATTGAYGRYRSRRPVRHVETSKAIVSACAVGVLRRAGGDWHGAPYGFMTGFDTPDLDRDDKGFLNGREVRAAVEAAGIEFV